VIYPIVWKFVSNSKACIGDLFTNHGMIQSIGVTAAVYQGQDDQFNFTLFSHGYDSQC
jgi:hypothetical protein